MRFALLMVFSVFSQMNASSDVKIPKISLDVTDFSITEVFEKIESLTEFNFFYSNDDILFHQTVSIAVEDQELNLVLDQLFVNIPFEYVIRDKQIVVTKNESFSVAEEKKTKEEKEITQQSVEGTVLDIDGQPLPGASIVEKGTVNGTQTDFDGNFSLAVTNQNAVLLFSYIGHQTQEISVKGQSTFQVVLLEDAAKLDEVVLIGYGSVAKKELTGSAVQAENIENRSVTKVEEALQGNVSGVTVLSNGGDPTSTPRIQIRGVGTTSDESPLWVVDGVPYYGGPINPFDIESLTVLKDAAAASIYGVRAAGGVILVTTKQGKEGKISVDFGSFVGVQNVWNKPVALNAKQYTDAYNLAYDNSSAPRLNYFDGVANPDRLVDRTNWVDEIFQTGLIQNYDVGIRGGTEKYNFSSSIGYNTKDGILLNTFADRFSFRYNSNVKFNDQFKIGQNFLYTVTNGQSIFTGTQAENGETNYNGIIAAAIKAPPFVAVYNSNGTYSDISDGNNGDVLHPVATLKRISIDNPEKSTYGNVFLEYKPISNLTLKTNFGINHTNENFEEFDPRVPEASKISKTVNTLTQIQSDKIDWSWENTASYIPKLTEKNSLQLLGGYSIQYYKFDVNSIRAQGFENESPSLISLPLAERITQVQYFFEEESLASYFGRVLYDFDKKYFVSASVRRDATSKIVNKTIRSESFPSVALGWSLSEEDFFTSNFINNLKLRASWGRVGNIESLGAFPTDVPLSFENIILAQQGYVIGISEDAESNPDIMWEISETTNFGLDFNSEDNRFSLTADYFIRDTKRLQVQTPPSPLQGVGVPAFRNEGLVKNSGLELNLGVNKYEGDFTYGLNGNVTFIKNELIELSDDITRLPEGRTQVATHFPLQNAVGQPLYSFYLIETDGLIRTDADLQEARANGQPNASLGDVRFIDQDNSGKIDDDDRVFKGSNFPKATFGLNGNFEYKNFDLSVFFQGISGAVAYNGYKFTTAYPAHTSVAGSNLSNVALNTWSPQNSNAANPRLSIDDPNGNIRESDFWLESTDYIRLKNLSLGYSFEGNDIYKTFRIYATAQNVFTWTDYSGLDPEVANRGLDGGQYPLSRVFTLGFNITLN